MSDASKTLEQFLAEHKSYAQQVATYKRYLMALIVSQGVNNKLPSIRLTSEQNDLVSKMVNTCEITVIAGQIAAIPSRQFGESEKDHLSKLSFLFEEN